MYQVLAGNRRTGSKEPKGKRLKKAENRLFIRRILWESVSHKPGYRCPGSMRVK